VTYGGSAGRWDRELDELDTICGGRWRAEPDAWRASVEARLDAVIATITAAT
jgi:hypothetical protein